MKKAIAFLVALLYIAGLAFASAEEVGAVYTDVTSMLTQDSVLSVETFSENAVTETGVSLMQPDESAMRLLEEVYDFVWRKQNPPVRFFDPATQQKIQFLVPDVDIDTLHMSEFMAQTMTGEPTEAVVVERTLEADYRPGQLVIVVLGFMQEDGEYKWFPYLATVPANGMIRYELPCEEYIEISAASQVIYTVLSDREGPGSDIFRKEEYYKEENSSPSKTSEDVNRIERWHREDGTPINSDFCIKIVDQTEEMHEETRRIGDFLAGGEAKILDWFPEEIVREAGLLLEGDIQLDEMIAYDIIAVIAENYQDTYGDVVAEIRFASAYTKDKKMFVFLGFPMEEGATPSEEGTQFVWYCQRAEVIEENPEIAFKQLVLPQMEIEPAILIVFSQPLEN